MGDVADGELLYRSVRLSDVRQVDSVPRLSASAFNDRDRKASVDVASLRASPGESKKNPLDGVAVLLTSEVRAVDLTVQKPPASYVVDVWLRPEPDNRAHAQIEPTPDLTGSRFDKLKEALVILASRRQWEVIPGDG